MLEFIVANTEYIEKIVLLTIVVGIFALSHILAKVFYNTNNLKEVFNTQRLFVGIFKGIVVILMIVSLTLGYLSFIYLKVVNDSMIDPLILLYGTAIFYFTKIVKSLSEILGYNVEKSNQELPKIEKNLNEVKTDLDTNKLKEYINIIDDILK